MRNHAVCTLEGMLLEPCLDPLQWLVRAPLAALSVAGKLSAATFPGKLPGKEEARKGQPLGLKVDKC